MKRPSGELGLIVGFVLVLVLVTAVLSGRKLNDEPETRPHRSIRSAGPGGWKALATLLTQQGTPNAALEVSPEEWPADAAVIITGPVFTDFGSVSGTWTKSEAKAAHEWMKRGGTLIRFDNEWSELDEELKLLPKPESEEPEESAPSSTQASPRPAQASPLPTEDITAVLCQPIAWLRGVTTIGAPDLSGLPELPRDALALVRVPGSENGNIASLHPLGKGRLILVHSGAFVDNEHLTKYDNARFASQLIRAMALQRPGRVLFDEYHQGYAQAGKSIWDLIGLGFRRAFVHLGLVLILAFLVAGKRFGRPVPLPPRTRTSAEYATSVADLYRRAGRRDAALESLFLRFRRDLCRTAQVETDTIDAILARRVAQSQGRPDQEAVLLALLGECRKKIEQGPKQFKESELIALAQALDAARKELRIGGRH